MIKQYKLRFYNFRLVIFLLAISFIGIQLVGTAADYLRTRQLLGVIIGVVFMLILSLMDYSWLLNFQWIMYGFNIVMLLAVRFFGSSANGAARWFYPFPAYRAFKDHHYPVFCQIFYGS